MQIQATAVQDLGDYATFQTPDRRPQLWANGLNGLLTLPTAVSKRSEDDTFWLQEDCKACDEGSTSLPKLEPTTTPTSSRQPKTVWKTSTSHVAVINIETIPSDQAEETPAVSLPMSEAPSEGAYVSIWIGPLGACLQRL